MAEMRPPAAGRGMAVRMDIQQFNRGNFKRNYSGVWISAKVDANRRESSVAIFVDGAARAGRRTRGKVLIPIAWRRRYDARADADPGMGVELLPARHSRRSDWGQSRRAALMDFRGIFDGFVDCR